MDLELNSAFEELFGDLEIIVEVDGVRLEDGRTAAQVAADLDASRRNGE